MHKFMTIIFISLALLFTVNISAQPVSEVFAGIEMIKTSVPKIEQFWIQSCMIFNLYPYLKWNWVGIRVARNAR